MKEQQDFTPQRIVANHCAELIGEERSAADRAAVRGRFLADSAARFADHLDAMFVAAKPVVSARLLDPKEACETLEQRSAERSLNVRVVAPMDDMFASIDATSAQRLTDRMFGGHSAGDEPGDALPASVLLVAGQLVALLVASIANCEASDIDIGKPVAWLGQLKGRPRGKDVAIVAAEISSQDEVQTILLGLRAATLDKLVAGDPAKGVAASALDSLLAAPMGDIELPVAARLANFPMAVPRIAALSPGDLLSFVPDREIALRVDHRPLAFGQLGSRDERLALRLTRLA